MVTNWSHRLWVPLVSLVRGGSKLEKTKYYENAVFSFEVLQEAIAVFRELRGKLRQTVTRFVVGRGTEEWTFDSQEEFGAEYRNDFHKAAIEMGEAPRALIGQLAVLARPTYLWLSSHTCPGEAITELFLPIPRTRHRRP